MLSEPTNFLKRKTSASDRKESLERSSRAPVERINKRMQTKSELREEYSHI